MTTIPAIHLTRGCAGCQLAVREGAVTIVVDALRASTTIAAFLTQGVARVLVVAGVEDARALAARTPGAMLAGERGGERLPGFDLGNSPLEALAHHGLAGATVVFTSSNGAQRLAATCGADRTLVGTVSTASAVADHARAYATETGLPVVLVAAGLYPDEEFRSPEDEAACAYLAARIGLPIAEDSLADLADWEKEIATCGLQAIFHGSAHAQHLMRIGYARDVEFCARPNTLDAVPIVTGLAFLDDRQIGVEVRLLPEEGSVELKGEG